MYEQNGHWCAAHECANTNPGFHYTLKLGIHDLLHSEKLHYKTEYSGL